MQEYLHPDLVTIDEIVGDDTPDAIDFEYKLGAIVILYRYVDGWHIVHGDRMCEELVATIGDVRAHMSKISAP